METLAIDQLKAFLDLNPSEFGFLGLGKALMKEDRYEEAVEAFRRAIKLKPDYTAVYLELGEALQNLNRWEEAARVYKDGIQIGNQTRDMIPIQKMQNRLKRMRRKRMIPDQD